MTVAAVGAVAAVLLAGYSGVTDRQLRLTPGSVAMSSSVAFTAMELGEHLTHGSTLASALLEPSLWIGLALQLMIASVACLLLRVTEAVGQRLARRRRAVWRRLAVGWRVPRRVVAFTETAFDPASSRGPPLLVFVG